MSSGWPFLFVGVHYALFPLFALLKKMTTPMVVLSVLSPAPAARYLLKQDKIITNIEKYQYFFEAM